MSDCPDCGKPSGVGYCESCEKSHERMFYRTIFHIGTLNPLTVFSSMLWTDDDGNFTGSVPFLVKEHTALPEDSLPGDICIGYININSVLRFERKDGVIIHTIERLHREGQAPTWEDILGDECPEHLKTPIIPTTTP